MARTFILCAALLSAAAASAEIVIAQVSPTKGPLAVTAVGNHDGARAYIESVNAQGGVNGQKIRFVHEDDQYKPEETVRLVELVAARDKPLAFVNLFGSANVLALQSAKVFDRVKVPAIGATPGAEGMRKPGSPWIFHTHAGDQAQIRHILRHLSTLGISRIALAYQDNPMGKSGLGHFNEAVAELKLEVRGRVAVPPVGEQLAATAKKLQETGAQAYVMVLVRNSGAALVRDVRAAGDRTPMYAMSYVPAEAILEKAPLESAVGVGVAQVMPNAGADKTLLAREFRAAMRRYVPNAEPSNPHLTGYVAARVAVEAIRRAGPSPTPEKVMAAMRQVRLDLGGLPQDFSDGQNVGTQWVDIGVVDRRGQLMY
ncbi:ABC transporter substrate-binding protein [Ramlibacter pallidus]|uniref:ABC transporter substrate-binding protein n=1 Tax=Ramlibacter pallidus TaxID=2780087 RepID=A0ABR9S642_9BURK|nr:ABC transporter substrate-binding protein [Ramlibacter pallidus]MBE7368983.1 ABC transporter substrate-binding protein [Ramlibacter pallidus]